MPPPENATINSAQLLVQWVGIGLVGGLIFLALSGKSPASVSSKLYAGNPIANNAQESTHNSDTSVAANMLLVKDSLDPLTTRLSPPVTEQPAKKNVIADVGITCLRLVRGVIAFVYGWQVLMIVFSLISLTSNTNQNSDSGKLAIMFLIKIIMAAIAYVAVMGLRKWINALHKKHREEVTDLIATKWGL